MNSKMKYFSVILVAVLAVVLIWRHFQGTTSSTNNPASGKVQKIYQQQAKIDAAWAMLRAGEGEPYYSYLMDFAKAEISGQQPWNGYGKNPYEYSLKILASIKSPEIKAMLEGALDSNNTPAVEIAIVNLIFNQGSSDKVKQLILNELNEKTSRLDDWDFIMKIAVLLNDPQINAAGEAFEQRQEQASWSYYEDRKNWSVYTWIDDYVVDLNGSRQAM
jgi:hypothetical protein